MKAMADATDMNGKINDKKKQENFQSVSR